MKNNTDIPLGRDNIDFPPAANISFDQFALAGIGSQEGECERTVEITDDCSNENITHLKETKPVKKTHQHHLETVPVVSGENKMHANLFRLFVKNGEFVYARPNDIIMMESCDHIVKVYLAINDKIKKTVRHNTLKDFLLMLPPGQFLRIGRFCAVNTQRLSGGNCNDQTFEFDFRVAVKLKHDISHTAFCTIGK